LNDIAGGLGPLTVALADNATGHASFSPTYAGELLQGEATRVAPHSREHAMNMDICITRAIYCSLKEYGTERIARWTLSMARRRMRLARSRPAFHV
jgi:hypothetical protein